MSAPYNAIVRFQYDPDPENASDDLQLTVDETITVTEVVDDDWLFGSKQLSDGSTASGYFPRSFVAQVEEKEESAGSSESIADHTESETVHVEPEQKQEQHMEVPTPSNAIENIESNIVHEPENFKNKLQSFNVSSTPIMPQEKRNDETSAKKSFNGIEHRSSYIPPTFGTSNQVKKEETKPVGEVVRSDTHVEEEVAPSMSVKERMLLLQKQQAEQEAMLAAAMKRLEEKKKKSKRSHKTASAADEVTEAEVEANKSITVSSGDNNSIELEENNEYLDAEDGEDAGGVDENEKKVKIDSQDEEENDNDDEAGDEEDEDEDDEEDDEEDDDDEDEEEEDEEEVRKRELAQRMAKLSGGIGMMGMMGMMPSPLLNKNLKKSKKKEVKEEVKTEESMKPVPILPTSGVAPPLMGMPLPVQSPSDDKQEEEKDDDSIEKEKANNELVAEKEQDDTEQESEKSSIEEVPVPVHQATSSHPYRTHAAPPPPPPVTQVPEAELNPFPEPPSVPTGLPPSMPHTMNPAERPPMPPPPAPTRTTKEAPPPPPAPGAVPSIPAPTTTLTAPPPVPGAVPSVPTPTVTMTAPPPVPGAVPSAPAPTVTMTAPPPPVPGAVPAIPGVTVAPPHPVTHQPHPFAPTAPPPVPNDNPVTHTHDTVSRKSSVASKPPTFHAPPPPVPAEGGTPAPPVINRQLTRTSLESTVSTPLPPKSVSPTNNLLWWTTGSLPPQLLSSESLFEVETTDIKKRNGDVVRYVIYYILDVHLACTTLELAYHLSEPERILFYHETKEKTRSDPEQLIREYATFGAHSYNAALKLLGQNVGSSFIERVFAGIPGPVLPPVADKTFGAVVYRNNNGDSKFYEDIRPGDILVLVKATFESSSGVQNVGFEKPHVAIVTSFEADKEKIKVLEESGGVVHQARYRLNKMKSGKLRVFRVVGRSFVGW